MSFGRGRGGGLRGKTGLLSGLPLGIGAYDNKSNEYPTIQLPVNYPLTSKERNLAATYIKFANTIREGSFYTGSLPDGEGDEKLANDLVDERGVANDGIERYSDRYFKKRKIGASIDDHPFPIEFFPHELYSVMGINKKKLTRASKLGNEKDTSATRNNAEDLSNRTTDNDGLLMLEKLKELAENVNDENDQEDNAEKNEEDAAEDDLDDEYDDDDDDNDYNAEKYFDDGDGDDYGGEDDYGDEPAF